MNNNELINVLEQNNINPAQLAEDLLLLTEIKRIMSPQRLCDVLQAEREGRLRIVPAPSEAEGVANEKTHTAAKSRLTSIV